MVSLESLIEQYGYAALLVGAFLEGETIVVMAGFAAHREYLSLPWVIAVAFLGALAGDQMWFYVGRRKGQSLITARPRWARRVQRLQELLARYDWLVVLGFRFVYGLRTVTPVVLAASGYSPGRFTALNIAGAAIWSVVVSLAGYLFGHTMELLIDDVKRYERWLLGLLVFCSIAAWLWRTLPGRRNHADSASHTPRAP